MKGDVWFSRATANHARFAPDGGFRRGKVVCECREFSDA